MTSNFNVVQQLHFEVECPLTNLVKGQFLTLFCIIGSLLNKNYE